MKSRNFGAWIASMITLTLTIGCAVVPVVKAEVEGTLTYDGEPIQAGIVSFVPIEPAGSTPFGGAIQDGKYHIYPETGLQPGKYRVEIRWSKPTGEKVKDAGYGQSSDVYAEALPAKYHSESNLTAQVIEGANTIDFVLEK